jgi:predicted acylesterase/phospholipase RssA
MKVIDAVCMSISVPLLFESVKYNNQHYVDGGIIENTPCQPFIHYKSDEVLVVQIKYRDVYIDGSIGTLKKFVETLICTVMINRFSYDDIIKPYNIDIGSVNAFDFSMNYEQKLNLYLLGAEHNLATTE